MPEIEITWTYPDAVAERRKWLIAQIDETYDRLMGELKRRYPNATPPACEVQAVHVRCLEETMAFHHELTVIEQRVGRQYILSE